MNGAQVHLALNHFSIVGIAFSTIFLAAAAIRPSEGLRRSAFALVVLTGILTIPAFLSGEEAEEVIEHLPGVTEALIHDHEELAEKVAWGVWATAALAGFGWFTSIRKGATPRWVVPTTLVLCVAFLGLLGWTSMLGGRIRHPEVRPDFVQPAHAAD